MWSYSLVWDHWISGSVRCAYFYRLLGQRLHNEYPLFPDSAIKQCSWHISIWPKGQRGALLWLLCREGPWLMICLWTSLPGLFCKKDVWSLWSCYPLYDGTLTLWPPCLLQPASLAALASFILAHSMKPAPLPLLGGCSDVAFPN